MSDIDQQFIEYVVKSLVGKPEAVHIDRRIDEKGVLLELTVDPEDLGRVIGKRGATAQSLRTLLRALGTKNDARYNLKIIDNGVGDHSSGQGSSDTSAPRNDAKADTTVDDTTDDADQKDKMPDKAADSVADETIESQTDQEDQTSDRLRQARAELADLDDLDV